MDEPAPGHNPEGVAVDSKFIYWAEFGMSRIGRANLDGSGVNLNFINLPGAPLGIAVTANNGIYWIRNIAGSAYIGHANIDGSGVDDNFITTGSTNACGIAADQSFVYWLDNNGNKIGRAPLTGSSPDPNFITVPDSRCGLAVDSNFLYWGGASKNVGRAPVADGTADPNFIAAATPTSTFVGPSGVAVNPQYVFWGDDGHSLGSNLIGRANINGSSPNPSLISGVASPFLLAAAPSNKITINSITRKKKKGTAIINAKVPGPGQVSITNTGTEDVAATANVKLIGLTLTGASSFKLPVKPKGKTAKKLKKQVKRKGKGKVKVKAFVTFVPAGVAGVSNSLPVKTSLVKQLKRKK